MTERRTKTREPRSSKMPTYDISNWSRRSGNDRRTDAELKKDKLDGEEDLEDELEHQADEGILLLADDLDGAGEQLNNFRDETVDDGDDEGDFSLDEGDNLLLGHGSVLDVFNCGVDLAGVLLDFNNDDFELLADCAVAVGIVDGSDDFSVAAGGGGSGDCRWDSGGRGNVHGVTSSNRGDDVYWVSSSR